MSRKKTGTDKTKSPSKRHLAVVASVAHSPVQPQAKDPSQFVPADSYAEIKQPEMIQTDVSKRKITLIWFILIAISAAIQWSDGKFSGRDFIDYDDLSVVTPMLKLNWTEYWSRWFVDRTNYAFPLRDATLFFDQWLSQYFSRGVFWVSQFVLHAVSMFCIAMLFARMLGPKLLWIAIPIALVVLHPLQVESIQWINCRKYVVPAVPLFLGSLLVFRWMGTGFSWTRGLILIALWLMALLCYPTGALWIFWAYGALWIGKRQTRQMLPWVIAAVLIAVLYLAAVGRGTGEVNAGLGSVLMNFEKTWFFGSNALGRGFWNLILPFWLAPYYNELSYLNRIGFVALILFSGFLIYLAARFFNDLRVAFVSLALGLIFLVPVANTILSFHDFMLADRHFYLSLPYFVLSAALIVRFCWQSYTKNLDLQVRRIINAAAITVFAAWGVAAILTAVRYVPQWRNSFVLMSRCAADEESPRCQSQVARRVFFKDQCSVAQDSFNRSQKIFRLKPPFALEFRTEMPFYNTSCTALAAKLSSDEKLQKIDAIAKIYDDSAEVIFSLVLVYLEKGDLKSALELAQTYYLGPLDKGAIFVTNTLLAVYRGHIEALCEIDRYGPCQKALERFRSLHPGTEAAGGAIEWGRSATRMMAKRGGLM
jgi:hypothetical protein